jgi:hypothetical protein
MVMASNQYFVKASLDANGDFADCSYFFDAACTQPASSPMHISQGAGACYFIEAASSDLLLVGAVYKTLGQAPVLNGSNFAPASDEQTVGIAMPVDTVVTKGVVLMFANRGVGVTSLFPSSDPQIVNDQP